MGHDGIDNLKLLAILSQLGFVLNESHQKPVGAINEISSNFLNQFHLVLAVQSAAIGNVVQNNSRVDSKSFSNFANSSQKKSWLARCTHKTIAIVKVKPLGAKSSFCIDVRGFSFASSH